MNDDRIEELREALRRDPASRQFYQLGELLRKAGRLQEAEDVLRRGLERHPRYVAAWVSLARTLAAAGDDEGAEWAAARALETDPQNAVAARLIAESAERRGDHRRAASAWRLASVLTPGDTALAERARAAEARVGGGEAAAAPGPEAGAGPAGPPAGPLPGEIVTAGEEDPFAVEPTGDTDVFLVGDDVFAVGGGGAASAVGGPFGAPAPGEAGPGEVAGAAAAPREPVGEAASEAEAAAAAEEAPAVPPPGAEPTRPIPEAELPLPTVTLARLALEQDDLELAERTLERLREIRGEDPEVAALAREIAARRAGEVPLPARKIERLKGWLDHIRLAAERSGGGLR